MPGKGLAPYGIRYAGQGVKGQGYYGQLPYAGASEETNYGLHSSVATELSSEDEDIGHYPLIVPGLSKEELNLLLSGKEPTENIQKIAREHAINRKQKGKNPFALPTELKYPLPEKAEGGKINPIKTPREMLFEMAGLTFMAGGGKAGAGAEMYKLITQAIERYTKTYGKPPNPEDVKALKEHAKQLSVKPEIKTDPTTQARARHEMATDPNLINPEGPDPFLTKATTGRTVKSTYLKPKVQDINDPNVRQNIEVKQAAGELEEVLPESTTPSADYMARMSKGIENEALASGKTPLIDKLKASFFAKYKRYPTDDELESIIAEFNPARHQYGEKGPGIVTERPPTAKGMAEWKSKARLEGIPEAYIEKTPGNYPKYLQDELQLGKGIQPGTKPLPDTRINPDRQYAGGSSVAPMSPAEMQAMMLAYGKTPSKFMPEGKLEKIMRGVSVPAAAMSAHMAGQKLTEGDPYEAALYGASALGSGMAASRKFLKPGLGIAGAAAVPLSVDEAIRRYKKGDRTGAVIAAIEAAGNAAAMYPPTAIPGSIVSFGAGMANAFRGEPEQKSVMEDYK